MRLLVCGGRNYGDIDSAIEVLDFMHRREPITMIIHGGAKGADEIGAAWALIRGVPIQVYHPDWEKWGRAAGPLRNSAMLVEGKPDAVVAFEGGAGTANMVKQALKRGVAVYQVRGNQVFLRSN